MTVKGQGHPKLTVSSLELLLQILEKFQTLPQFCLLIFFASYLEELLLIKLSLILENFIAKYKRFVRYLGPNLGITLIGEPAGRAGWRAVIPNEKRELSAG